jgi:hypothetical protein
MDVRIIGLAPLKEDKDEISGQLKGSFSPLFWVYFPEAREILINAEVFNLVKNNIQCTKPIPERLNNLQIANYLINCLKNKN